MSIAKSYARALYETAVEGKSGAPAIDKLETELAAISKALEASREARVALFTPATGTKEKVTLIEAIASKTGLSKTLSNFLVLLARKERLPVLSQINEAFTEVRLEAEGGIQGTLVSADPLESADVDGLARAFSQKLGKKVEFRTETDSSLLAGMKVVVNGVTYDGTLRSQLQRLRDRLVYGTGPTAH